MYSCFEKDDDKVNDTMKKTKRQKPDRNTGERKEPPKRTVLEEVGNAVTHGVGALLSIAGAVLLLVRSKTGPQLTAAIIYGFCLLMMFLMSCLYHSFRWGSTVKRLWRRFDYIAIYLLIGVFGPEKARPVHMTLYVVLGWCGLIFMPRMFRNDLPLFLFILGGGLLYTLGIIPFALKRRGAHFIWHFFVLFAAVAHWFGIFLYLY